MTVHADLLAAYALIQDEARWCKGAYRSRTQGKHVRRCLQGALDETCLSRAPRYAVRRAITALFGQTMMIEAFNDHYGHRAALMVLRHAILREEDLA